MNLWLRVAMRVLTRSLDFVWTGALTMFVVGALSGVITGSVHLILSAFFDKSNQPVLAILFGTVVGAGLFGAACGGFSYGIAGAVSSRHDDAERVVNFINRWIFHLGIAGMVGGYLNGLIYLLAGQSLSGRKLAVFNLLSFQALEICAALGFFLLTFTGAIWGAKKAMLELDKS